MNFYAVLLVVTFASLCYGQVPENTDPNHDTKYVTNHVTKYETNPKSTDHSDIYWDSNTDFSSNMRNELESIMDQAEENWRDSLSEVLVYVREQMQAKYGGYWSAFAYNHGYSKVEYRSGYYGKFQYKRNNWIIFKNY